MKDDSSRKEAESDIYARVTNHILRAMEEGPGKVRLPWHKVSPDSLLPRNAKSQEPYKGVNVLCLWATAQEREYESGEWATYRQWKEMGAQVRKGEKGTPVVFWKVEEREGVSELVRPEGEKQEDGRKNNKRVIARGYTVFNADQVEGYTPKPRPVLPESERIKHAEEFFNGLGAKIIKSWEKGAAVQAAYSSYGDFIYLPPFSHFKSAEGYYSVLAHEITHWTGAEKRLARNLSGRFGSEAYAAEELVAELGAAFQLAKLQISPVPRQDHAAYLQSWVSLLRDDKRAIFAAASKAQEAVEFLTLTRSLRESEREEMEHKKPHEKSHPVTAEKVQSPEQNPTAYVAKRAETFERLVSRYDGDDRSQLTDVLADARHWAEARGVSFGECLRLSKDHHRYERSLVKGKESEGPTKDSAGGAAEDTERAVSSRHQALSTALGKLRSLSRDGGQDREPQRESGQGTADATRASSEDLKEPARKERGRELTR